jgi:predicted aspartyl protease
MGRILGQIVGGHGALFSVKLMASPQRVAKLKSLGMVFPVPVVGRALVDTGASHTCIDIGIINALGLSPTGSTPVHTPSTRGAAIVMDLYDVSVVFGDGKPGPRTYTLELIETDLASQGFDLLVGRDILARCILNYDGPNGVFSIAF